jgi:hypothetical protein
VLFWLIPLGMAFGISEEGGATKYQNLTANINDLLKNVYYVYGVGSGTWVASTGFSMEYKDKFYLITAGHVVDCEWGIHKNLRFRANFSNKWIYPKLIAYNNDYMAGSDYAIFYSDKIESGLKVDFENDDSAFVIGCEKLNINIIKDSDIINIVGESGSPIIDIEGEVTGISTTNNSLYYTDISNIELEINKTK